MKGPALSIPRFSDRNLRRLASRAIIGLGRTGSAAANGSGDYVIAFSTNSEVRRALRQTRRRVLALANDEMSALFQATVEATEGAIYNSLFAGYPGQLPRRVSGGAAGGRGYRHPAGASDCADQVKPFADHFSRLAPAYASCRPAYPDELFDYLAGLVSRHDLAWDCAAGSGQATIPLARRFNRVIATDISAAMLQQAPRHPAVEYRAAPAETSGLEDASADLVTVAQALHWLDTETFYAEAARVLVPGGVLAVWTYGSQQLDEPALDGVLRRFYADIVGPYWPAGRRHVESGYRTLSFPFPEIDPPVLAMEERWSLTQLLAYVRTWSATQRFREVVGQDPVEQLGQDLARHWGDPSASRRIRWPLSLRVGCRAH